MAIARFTWQSRKNNKRLRAIKTQLKAGVQANGPHFSIKRALSTAGGSQRNLNQA